MTKFVAACLMAAAALPAWAHLSFAAEFDSRSPSACCLSCLELFGDSSKSDVGSFAFRK